MRSFGAAMAALSLAVLTAGLLWPHLALVFFQSLVTALALAYVGARIHRARLPTALASDTYSPFDSGGSGPRRSGSPPGVRRLSTLLQSAADPGTAERALIPPDVRRILVAEASRRLAEHHGVRLDRPDGHERARDVLADATWSLVRAERTKDARWIEIESVPMSLLEEVLDDVERL